MKFLYYVSFWRKSVRLLGPAGEDIHFQTPVLAGEISARYPDHRLFDSCGAPVPSHSQLKRGSTYILTPATNSRHGDRRGGRSSSASPSELRRTKSARPWHPSLEMISEDGAAVIPRKKKVQAMRKPAYHGASQPKNRDVVPGDGLYKYSAASAVLSVPSFAPSPFLF
ncbi:hypothetical protein EJ110_NYTH45528 [Nymphaea thermarum]|nr:hypothetical protein EJ110_NYTH45528 [Nymphaea thermarum]